MNTVYKIYKFEHGEYLGEFSGLKNLSLRDIVWSLKRLGLVRKRAHYGKFERFACDIFQHGKPVFTVKVQG